jgi:drug/metabolite transporter (DMT)-like permease
MNDDTNPISAYLALILAVSLWGSSFVAMKIALAVYDPAVVIFMRLLLASGVFAIVFRRIRGVTYQKGDWKWFALMAFFEPYLYFFFEGYAIRYTTASQAGMITAILPLMTAVTARFILSERVRGRTWAGFIISICGVVWLTLAGEPEPGAPNPMLGNFLEVLAMASACGYFIILKRLTATYDPWYVSAMQAFLGCLYFLPTLALPVVDKPDVFDPLAVGMIAFLGLVVSLGAYGLYNFGVSRMPVSQATAFINLIPVVAVVTGWALLGEQFNSWQWAAAALVMFGVWLSQSGRRRRARQ